MKTALTTGAIAFAISAGNAQTVAVNLNAEPLAATTSLITTHLLEPKKLKAPTDILEKSMEYKGSVITIEARLNVGSTTLPASSYSPTNYPDQNMNLSTLAVYHCKVVSEHELVIRVDGQEVHRHTVDDESLSSTIKEDFKVTKARIDARETKKEPVVNRAAELESLGFKRK